MESHGKQLLGEHYYDEHLTYEEIQELGLEVVTEKARRFLPRISRARSSA